MRSNSAGAVLKFFWGDERAVGPDDPDSNYGLAKRLLLGSVRSDSRQISHERGTSRARRW